MYWNDLNVWRLQESNQGPLDYETHSDANHHQEHKKRTHVFDAGLGQGEGQVERDSDEHVGAADQAEGDVGVPTLEWNKTCQLEPVQSFLDPWGRLRKIGAAAK